MAIIDFESLPSTNTYAKEHFDALQHNDIVLAVSQSAGRGRKGRSWSSEEGGLYFSLVLKSYSGSEDISKISSFTQLMAVAVCKTILDLGAKCYLKWPNDVLINGKKFCGVLSEAVFTPVVYDVSSSANAMLSGLIIGVGINIKQQTIESNKPFTTLGNEGIKVEKSVLIDTIIDNFNTFKRTNFIEKFKEYCPSLGKEITVDGKTGIFEDIDITGRLLLKTSKGVEIISVGDVII